MKSISKIFMFIILFNSLICMTSCKKNDPNVLIQNENDPFEILNSYNSCYYKQTIYLAGNGESARLTYEVWIENGIKYVKSTGSTTAEKKYYATIDGVTYIWDYDFVYGTWKKEKVGHIDNNEIDFFDKNNYNKVSRDSYELKSYLDAGQYTNVTVKKNGQNIVITYFVSFNGYSGYREDTYIDFNGSYGLKLPTA